MPQRPLVRRKQKARRTKQLAQWRAKQAAKAGGENSNANKANKKAG